MVKKALMVILVLIFAAAFLPQAASADAKAGIKGGFSLARFRVTPGPSAFEDLPWATGGVFLKIGYGPLAIQPEGLYVRMGAKFDDLAGDEFTERFDYIQIPVLVRFTFLYGGPIRPVIFAGPYGAILISAKEVVKPVAGTETTTNVKSTLHKADWGAVFGAGIDFEFGMMVLSIEGRYSLGIYDINDTFFAPGNKLHNRAAMAYVGIGF